MRKLKQCQSITKRHHSISRPGRKVKVPWVGYYLTLSHCRIRHLTWVEFIHTPIPYLGSGSRTSLGRCSDVFQSQVISDRAKTSNPIWQSPYITVSSPRRPKISYSNLSSAFCNLRGSHTGDATNQSCSLEWSLDNASNNDTMMEEVVEELKVLNIPFDIVGSQCPFRNVSIVMLKL